MLVGAEIGDVGTSQVSGTCHPSGYSTFRFAATGSTQGPYEGSFIETGSFTLGPVTEDEFGHRIQRPVSFHSIFRVRAADTQIVGAESLSPQQPATEWGACGQGLAQPGQVTPNAIGIQLETSYWAHIVEHRRVAHGNLRHRYVAVERGDAYVDYGDLGVRGIPNFQSFRFRRVAGGNRTRRPPQIRT
jgi:hypothetical protein